MFEKLTASNQVLSIQKAEEYAFDAIKGPNNADAVVLGKYVINSSSSYDEIARKMNAQYFNLDKGIINGKKLVLLCEYLKKNGYEKDAKVVEEITCDILKKNSMDAKKRLVVMCNPRYLGDLKIAQFKNVYDWWNFLSKISSEVENSSK